MLRRWCAAAIVVIAAALVTAPGTAGAEAAELAFDFESGPDGAAAFGEWSSGCFRTAAASGCVRTSGEGRLRGVERAGGFAIGFPAVGSAVIRIDHDDAYNPRSADFTIAALVRLAPGQAKAGANIVQKGSYASARGQWKMQVDSGVPSCRVAGSVKGSRAIAEVRAGRVLKDEWTALRCAREGSTLRLYVNGVKVDSSGNAHADVNNMDPVLIGGKHAGPRNDQFRGALDDVRVDIT